LDGSPTACLAALPVATLICPLALFTNGSRCNRHRPWRWWPGGARPARQHGPAAARERRAVLATSRRARRRYGTRL